MGDTQFQQQQQAQQQDNGDGDCRVQVIANGGSDPQVDVRCGPQGAAGRRRRGGGGGPSARAVATARATASASADARASAEATLRLQQERQQERRRQQQQRQQCIRADRARRAAAARGRSGVPTNPLPDTVNFSAGRISPIVRRIERQAGSMASGIGVSLQSNFGSGLQRALQSSARGFGRSTTSGGTFTSTSDDGLDRRWSVSWEFVVGNHTLDTVGDEQASTTDTDTDTQTVTDRNQDSTEYEGTLSGEGEGSTTGGGTLRIPVPEVAGEAELTGESTRRGQGTGTVRAQRRSERERTEGTTGQQANGREHSRRAANEWFHAAVQIEWRIEVAMEPGFWESARALFGSNPGARTGGPADLGQLRWAEQGGARECPAVPGAASAAAPGGGS